MPSSGYTAITFVASEQPTTAKWNLIGSNFESFRLGNAIEDSAILARHIAANVIGSSKIDWASATGKIWFEELGRTTLAVAGDTIAVTGLAAKKYLHCRFQCIASGAIVPTLKFNNDGCNNYSERYLFSGTFGNSVSVQNVGNISNSGAVDVGGVIDIVNHQTKVKTGQIRDTAGNNVAGTAPDMIDFWFKWVNTTDQITRVDLVNTGAGDFAIGSELIVLGHD